MPEFRSRKDEGAYSSWREANKSSECLFCEVKPGHDQHIKSFNHFNLVRNIFPYSLWDSMGVEEHILLSPFRHVDSISDFYQSEGEEFLRVISDYESRGYSVYFRAKGSNAKSITHQHAHLIKLNDKKKKLIFYLARPFVRIAK